MAKMQTRVRLSGLKAGLVVGEKGSALKVTDSRAIARVFVAWLNRTGFLLVAAATVLLIKTQTRKAKKNL
jgi:phage gp16-like protein